MTSKKSLVLPEQSKWWLSSIIICWFLALGITIAIIIMLIMLALNVSSERSIRKNQVDLIAQGTDLAETSDFLTREVRDFVVGHEPQHLYNYWHEIDVLKTRDKIAEKLQLLGANKKELELMQEAAKKSEAIIFKETSAMKLVLSAFKVPTNMMPPQLQTFLLPPADNKLTAEEKLKKARELLFDDAFDSNKMDMIFPMLDFQASVNKRIGAEEKVARSSTNGDFVALFILIGVLVLIVVGLIWLRATNMSAKRATAGKQSKAKK